MRLVNLDEFLDMPKGTLYCKYSPCVLDTLQIFQGKCGDDFLYSDLTEFSDVGYENENDLFGSILNDMEKDSTLSIDIDLESSGRDGMNNKKQKFLILEDQDIKKIINFLSNKGNTV